MIKNAKIWGTAPYLPVDMGQPKDPLGVLQQKSGPANMASGDCGASANPGIHIARFYRVTRVEVVYRGRLSHASRPCLPLVHLV
jgi:hypothetical protein